MEALARLAVRRPIAVLVLAAGALLLGVAAWEDLPVDLLPDVESPTVLVSLRSGDRPPLEMERIYGEVLEERLYAVPGLRELTLVARTGRIIATAVFEHGADVDFALVEVQKAASPFAADERVEEVVVRRFDPRAAPVIRAGIYAEEGRVDLVELRRLARRQLAPALERLPGIAEARVLGGREPEVRVALDPLRLRAHDLTLPEVASRLRAANVDVDAGTLEESERVLVVRGLARFRALRDVERVVLRYEGERESGEARVALRVGDVARVSLAEGEVRHLVRIDGREGVGLAIHKEAGANTVAVSRAARETLEQLAQDLPELEIRIASDEAALVSEAIMEVEEAALVGVALAVVVLALFLRALVPTLIVAFVVPVSLLATLFLMLLAGHSLNVMTLGGLALGAGMLVDNAIVVLESVFRRRDEGAPIPDAAASGTGAVGGAIAAGTLTTSAVFLPVLFVEGLAARLVAGLAFTVVISLLVSLVVAVLLIPALSRLLLSGRHRPARDPGRARLARVVRALLARPWPVVLAGLLAAFLGVAGLASLGTELMPPTDPRELSLRLVGPPGLRVESTAQAVSLVEEVVREAAEGDLDALYAEIGRLPDDDRMIRTEQDEENSARLVARLGADAPSASRIARRLSPALAGLEGFEVSFETGESALSRALGRSGPPVVVALSGGTLDELRSSAERVRAALAVREELWDVRSSFEGGPPELRVVLERVVADGLGVRLEDVRAELAAALDGLDATTFVDGDEEIPVVVRAAKQPGRGLEELIIDASSGARVRLGDVARIAESEGAREILRQDQRRVALVGARVAEGFTSPEAREAARSAIGDLALAPGQLARLAGEEGERVDAFRELRFAGLLAVLLVFMVLAGTFESLARPLVVLAVLPLAAAGVAALLVPLGAPIGLLAAIGLVVLAGVAVNDAILLVDTARRRIEAGVERRDAIAEAAGLRLRPILMTTLTTTLALLPLALAGGEAAALRAPLALTLIGGLAASTLGTLFVIPALLELVERPARRGGEGRERAAA